VQKGSVLGVIEILHFEMCFILPREQSRLLFALTMSRHWMRYRFVFSRKALPASWTGAIWALELTRSMRSLLSIETALRLEGVMIALAVGKGADPRPRDLRNTAPGYHVRQHCQYHTGAR